MKKTYSILDPDWVFRLVKREDEVTTLGEEKLRIEAELQELEADMTRKLAELPRWLRWLIKKGWPSIFRDL